MGTQGSELKPQHCLPFTVTLGRCLPLDTGDLREPFTFVYLPNTRSPVTTDLKPQARLQEVAGGSAIF